MKLNNIPHGLYHRARYDLRLEYHRPPVPPLREEDVAWVREMLAAWIT